MEAPRDVTETAIRGANLSDLLFGKCHMMLFADTETSTSAALRRHVCYVVYLSAQEETAMNIETSRRVATVENLTAVRNGTVDMFPRCAMNKYAPLAALYSPISVIVDLTSPKPTYGRVVESCEMFGDGSSNVASSHVTSKRSVVRASTALDTSSRLAYYLTKG